MMEEIESGRHARELAEISSELAQIVHHFAESLSANDRKAASALIAETLRAIGDGTSERTAATRWARPPDRNALKSYLADRPQTEFFDSPDFYFPVNRIMPRHTGVALDEFPSLSELSGTAQRPHRALNICIVSPDIDGPTRNGGIGTAYRIAAEFLAREGHKVTVLYTLGRYCEQQTIEHWIGHFAKSGIELVPLPDPEILSVSGPLGANIATSRAVYEWLKGRPFDLVHTTEFKGAGYVSLSAKRLGLAFADTPFLIKASSPTLWCLAGDAKRIESIDTLIRAYMERKSIEYADVVISPSRHLLRWMMRHGYDLPKERCFVQTNIMPPRAKTAPVPAPGKVAIDEIVFFGRFEPRKGIHIFLEALELLSRSHPKLKVTFLGKISPKYPLHEEITKRRARWSFDLTIIDDKDSTAAIEYLKGGRRIAILPSLLDNAPFTVAECLIEGIPFLTSDRGGGPEMISESDRPALVFDCVPSELAARIEMALKDGALVGRPSFDLEKNSAIWRNAHLAFVDPVVRQRFGSRDAHRTWNGASPIDRAPTDQPLVSVCIPHFNRPTQLKQAIASIRQQNYRRIEIIVVDDGSTLPAAHAYLDELQAELAAANIGNVLRGPNRYPGAARNAAMARSKGEFILLMDDDNVAKPDEIATFLRAADYSGADILCCYADTFTGAGLPSDSPVGPEVVTLLGDAISLGLFFNCFGDANCFLRRAVFETLGGFTEDFGIGLEDWEFFARAILRGFKFRVLPESLNWYRISETRIRSKHFDRYAGELRVLNAYIDNFPPALHEALRFAQAQCSRGSELRPTDAAKRGPTAEGRHPSGWRIPFARLASRLAYARDSMIIKSSGAFDPEYYLLANPDVAEAGMDPLTHFMRHGAYEGRKPNPSIDLRPYISHRGDEATGRANPLVEYLRANRFRPPYSP